VTWVSKLVVSDLHLSDGHPLHENWGKRQQRAWEQLLETAEREHPSAELIINGDCFDFLPTQPHGGDPDVTDSVTASAQMRHIIAAHPDWFSALRSFLRGPDRSVTFLIGNHDLELAFAATRALVRDAIDGPSAGVRFCLARAYRPMPDVEIEHGCQVDPWNRIPALWDAPQALTTARPDELETTDSATPGLERLELPFGSRYYARVLAPITERLPYFDAFVPALPQVGVLALACLYAPDLVVSGAAQARPLFDPAPARTLAADDPARAAHIGPTHLFQAVLPEVATLRQQVWQRAGAPVDATHQQAAAAYAGGVAVALAGDELAALRAIFATPRRSNASMPEDDDLAAAEMFGRSSALRIALCGHTHVEGVYQLAGGAGATTFVNEGTWFTRLALPGPADVNAALAAWLRAPRQIQGPLRDATSFTYALLREQPGHATSVELRAL
jgi:UDP-2,3-diacylglucosamine pyrophosphatase LpxH